MSFATFFHIYRKAGLHQGGCNTHGIVGCKCAQDGFCDDCDPQNGIFCWCSASDPQEEDSTIIAERALYSPDRDHQWQATRDSYEPGNPIGFGATADAAIADLQSEEEWRAA